MANEETGMHRLACVQIKNRWYRKPKLHNLQSTIRHTEIQLDHDIALLDKHPQAVSLLTSTQHAPYQLTERLAA